MGFRKQKLETQIKKLVGTLIVTEIKDPRIGFVTVTNVELSKDYAYADVYVSVLGDENTKKKSMAGLQSARGFIQYRVGKALSIRTIPEIRFHLDTSIEEGVDMVNLLEKLEKESSKNNSGSSDT
ncbi:MAG TPA: 30S ribosome-binding factor RbfA [Spirochaetota bacterium]|nr:30S ribosome-binding factor RbfA [Spirochaetota bacterium]HOM08557.1 30S ribosome-binding factor RbfA [Spirochaetota bacterium]HPP48376.1 30S ribosome-binding factor RbfA [Spirochaetota bacterium]